MSRNTYSFLPINSSEPTNHHSTNDGGSASSITSVPKRHPSILTPAPTLGLSAHILSDHPEAFEPPGQEYPGPEISRSKFRDAILAASEGICAPLPKRRRPSASQPSHQPKRKRKTSSLAEEGEIKISEDAEGDEHTTPIGSTSRIEELTIQKPSAKQSTGSTYLSEKSLSKLNAFKYKPKVSTDTNVNVAAFEIEKPASKQTVIHEHVDDFSEGQEDEFDIDDEIFDQILDHDELHPPSPVLEDHAPQDFGSDPFSSFDSTDQLDTQQTIYEEPSLTAESIIPPGPKISPDLMAKSVPKPAEPIPLPFIRTKAPSPVPHQNSIPDLSPTPRIVTCFRIAEVLRTLSHQATNALATITIELFATVVFSHRDDPAKKQHFLFADLFFPHRPPYIRGVYASWHGVDLFESDSAPFLESGTAAGNSDVKKLCRVIIKVDMKRWKNWSRNSGSSGSGNTNISPSLPPPRAGVGIASSAAAAAAPMVKHSSHEPSPNQNHIAKAVAETSAFEVTVHSIWEADWSDVEYTRGIVIGTTTTTKTT